MDATANIIDKLFLRVREVCTLLGISRSTFYRMVSQGEIRTVKVGGSRRVPQWELIRLLEQWEEETGVSSE